MGLGVELGALWLPYLVIAVGGLRGAMSDISYNCLGRRGNRS